MNKLKEIIFAVIVYVLVTMGGIITFLFRPLFVKVKQNNIMAESMKETVIDIQKEKMQTLQNQRTISISIILEKRGRSIWWILFKRLLKNQKVYLSIQSIPSNVGLQPSNFNGSMFSNNDKKGFNIELNDIFLELLNSNSEPSIEVKYEYYITLHPDFFVPVNATNEIEPLVYIKHNNDSMVAKLSIQMLKTLLKKEIELHKLRISKR